jgi:hypothetical protein
VFLCYFKARKLKMTVSVGGARERGRERERERFLGKILQIRVWCLGRGVKASEGQGLIPCWLCVLSLLLARCQRAVVFASKVSGSLSGSSPAKLNQFRPLLGRLSRGPGRVSRVLPDVNIHHHGRVEVRRRVHYRHTHLSLLR